MGPVAHKLSSSVFMLVSGEACGDVDAEDSPCLPPFCRVAHPPHGS